MKYKYHTVQYDEGAEDCHFESYETVAHLKKHLPNPVPKQLASDFYIFRGEMDGEDGEELSDTLKRWEEEDERESKIKFCDYYCCDCQMYRRERRVDFLMNCSECGCEMEQVKDE